MTGTQKRVTAKHNRLKESPQETFKRCVDEIVDQRAEFRANIKFLEDSCLEALEKFGIREAKLRRAMLREAILRAANPEKGDLQDQAHAQLELFRNLSSE